MGGFLKMRGRKVSYSIAKYVTVTIFILITGQSCLAIKKDQGNLQSDQLSNKYNLTICTDPRPQVCTMDYQPVCAKLNDENLKTYSNSCTACSDVNVVTYIS